MRKYAVLIVYILISGIIRCPVVNEKNYEMPDQQLMQKEECDETVNVQAQKKMIRNMEKYYGAYQIVQFCPTIYYKNRKYDVLPEQEANMLIGRIVKIEKDFFRTYDSERHLGTRDGRKAFHGNYMIKEFSFQEPQYKWEELDSKMVLEELGHDDMQGAVGWENFEKISGRISIQVTTPYYTTHKYYTFY